MKNNTRGLILSVAVIFLVLISFSLINYYSTNNGSDTLTVKTQFSAGYFFVSETNYQKIIISQSKLTLTSFEDFDGKCANWNKPSSCWSEEDLITKEITLMKSEVEGLRDVTNGTGFFDLESKYGKAGSGQRYGQHLLSVTLDGRTKDVIYQDFPNSEDMPNAFKEVRGRLLDLVNKRIKTVSP